MYPKCDWWIHWEKNDPEPTIYPRCSHWFPGHLAPSDCGSSSSPMPHQIFFVEDLVILIAKELVECSYFKWDVVSLALTCQALESPALSMLWARQTKLSTLIQVLPPNTLAYALCERFEGPTTDFFKEELVCDSTSLQTVSRLQFHARIS